METIGIMGAGAWGTALAQLARRAGHEVRICAREPEVAAAINATRRNPLFLPGVILETGLKAATDPAILAGADAILLAVPAQHVRPSAAVLGRALNGKLPPLVICAKGLELGGPRGGALMTEVLAEVLPQARFAVMSGPTFALEVAQGLPTAVTLACRDAGLGAALARALGTPSFRPYLGDDPVGAEVGGAVKNVLAIACGIAMGRKLGDNARAALITRGLAEILRLAVALGGKAETCMGLSGLGDLTLTCTGLQSRNLTLGVELGRGRKLADVLAERRSIAEGVASAGAVVERARRAGVEMPISAAVDAVLNRGADIDREIRALLARPFKPESA
ncbi:MAG: NAD(P)H-dependent glycerol-3-phosphate dehydrogenase [Rhodospirillales bacterium]